jgi:uncharacterized protein
MLQEEVIDKIRRYCLLLNDAGIRVEKAFLYGSWARKEGTKESDIDVMIISPDFDNQDMMLKAKAWRLTEGIDPKIEPYGVGSKKFAHDDVSPLLQVVREEGLEIKL